MKRGRPTRHKQSKIKKILQPHYQNSISASAVSNITQLNIKTVLKYFADWDKKLLESEDVDFLRRVKVAKEKSIQALDKEIIALNNQEIEVNSIRHTTKKNGDISNFEKLSRLKLKITDQKFKILSTKINLINTPTIDSIIIGGISWAVITLQNGEAQADTTIGDVKVELGWVETNPTYRIGVFAQEITFLDDTIKEEIKTKSLEESRIEQSSENLSTNNEGGGCLIATATYGSELAPQVQQLRELRDNSLLQTESGTSFMNTFNEIYYSFSPIIADYERENPVFKEMVKLAITPMITSLSILNYTDMDSESTVLGYGISLIVLNLAMYVGIPVVTVIGIRRI